MLFHWERPVAECQSAYIMKIYTKSLNLALVFTQVSFASFKWEIVLSQHYLDTGDKEAGAFLCIPMGDSYSRQSFTDISLSKDPVLKAMGLLFIGPQSQD